MSDIPYTGAEKAAAARARPLVQSRPSGVIQFWAVLGVAIVALALNNWIRWGLSSDFVQPDPGPDPYPYMWVLRGTEFVSSAVFVFLFWLCVLRPVIRERTLSLDGKLFIGGFFASTLDIMYGMYNPTWAMNAHAVSMGTWAGFFPGYASPAMEEQAWGLLWCLPAYIWLGVGAAIFGCAVLRWLRTRFPNMSTVNGYIVLQLLFMVIFACLATFWNRTEVYTYLSIPEGLGLWVGETYQLPLYEPLCIGFYCLGYTWLRDSMDDRGRCAVDREADKLPFSNAGKTLMSTLAVCGFAAVTTIVAYQVPFVYFAMKGDSHPQLPSYLQPGLWCGQEGKPLCANQYLNQQRELYYQNKNAKSSVTE